MTMTIDDMSARYADETMKAAAALSETAADRHLTKEEKQAAPFGAALWVGAAVPFARRCNPGESDAGVPLRSLSARAHARGSQPASTRARAAETFLERSREEHRAIEPENVVPAQHLLSAVE